MHKVLMISLLLILFDPMYHDGGGSAVCNGHRCIMYNVLWYKVLFTLFDPMEYDAQVTADTV